MEGEEMEDVSLDEKAGKEVVEKEEKEEMMDEVEGVAEKKDQVLAALGNIGRWQVQIIMITGCILASTTFSIFLTMPHSILQQATHFFEFSL